MCGYVYLYVYVYVTKRKKRMYMCTEHSKEKCRIVIFQRNESVPWTTNEDAHQKSSNRISLVCSPSLHTFSRLLFRFW